MARTTQITVPIRLMITAMEAETAPTRMNVARSLELSFENTTVESVVVTTEGLDVSSPKSVCSSSVNRALNCCFVTLFSLFEFSITKSSCVL